MAGDGGVGVLNACSRSSSWSQLVVPGSPVEVPAGAGIVIRLLLVARSGLPDGEDKGACLSVEVPLGSAGEPLCLARLLPGNPTSVTVHGVLGGGGESARLYAEGGPLLVSGDLVPADEPCASMRRRMMPPRRCGAANKRADGEGSDPGSGPLPTPTPEATATATKAKKAPPKRPANQDEYYQMLVKYVRANGPTQMRALASFVTRPRRKMTLPLKKLLLKNRQHLQVDVNGTVSLNYARSRRWCHQGAVHMSRRLPVR